MKTTLRLFWIAALIMVVPLILGCVGYRGGDGRTGSGSGDTAARSISSLFGLWQAEIEAEENSEWIALRFFPTGPDTFEGEFDLPDQLVRDIPLDGFNARGRELTIRASSRNFFLRAKVDASVQKMSGTMSIDGEEHTVQFEKVIFPSYMDPAGIVETPIILGSEPSLLKGAFTTPRDAENYPIVILLQGSGNQDRDGMLGPNRVYRDIAWGLANSGIASIRYDKRSFLYPGSTTTEASMDSRFMELEYIEDALTAIQHASGDPKATGIYLAGHSLGAIVAPSIASRSGNIDGLILLAPVVRRHAQLAIDINLYYNRIGKLDETAREGLPKVIDIYKKLLEKELPPDLELRDGIFAAYYYELDRYDLIDDLQAAGLPTLIVQGEKDFQALMDKDFLPLKQYFGRDERFTFKSYPELNHMFFTSPNRYSFWNEYREPAFVDRAVIRDIARWIAK